MANFYYRTNAYSSFEYTAVTYSPTAIPATLVYKNPYVTATPSPVDPYEIATSSNYYYSPTSSDPASSSDHPHRSSSKPGSKSAYEKLKLPPKAIGGIVVGVVAFFVGLIAAISVWFRRRKQRSVAADPISQTGPAEKAFPEENTQPEVQVYPVSYSSPQIASEHAPQYTQHILDPGPHIPPAPYMKQTG